MHLSDREKHEEIKSLNERFEVEKSMLRNEFKVVLDKVEHDRVKSVNDLEKELVKQRNRTIKLLEEKENELNKVKGIKITCFYFWETYNVRFSIGNGCGKKV